ncbi:MAG: 5-oxoprolinase subunit PxpA [Cypionkella sp.]
MVTINCDIGEAFGIYRFGDDAACMPYITHANVACGFHASDPMVMAHTVRLAKAANIRVGSHPGLPDREGFGRRPMRMSREEVANLTIYQTGALAGFLRAEGLELSHIKPHGSLFGMAQNDPEVAEGIADAAVVFGVPVIAYSDCCMSEVFSRRSIPFTCEFYVDINYGDDGRQIISREHPPISPEDVTEKVRRALDEGATRAVSGKDVRVVAESICVHSDTPNAIAIARAVYDELRLLKRLTTV